MVLSLNRTDRADRSARFAAMPVWPWLGIQHATPLGRLLIAGLGGLFGIFAVAVMVRHGPGGGMLIAPIGASAVLLFAVPASPLAQPWAIIGGNTISALCGIAWLKWTGDAAIAAPLAVGSAIAVMSLARCLHPPGGACALTTAIGGPAVSAAGWSFALGPVATDSAALVVAGLLFHRLMRTHYPHRAGAMAAPPASPAGFTLADVESVLAQYHDLLDVEADDLAVLFRQVEQRAWRRLHGVITCAAIMRHPCPALARDATLAEARAQFAASGLPALPVVDRAGHLVGVLPLAALAGPEMAPVAALVRGAAAALGPERAIDELFPALSGDDHALAVVVDPANRPIGLITQADLLATLWRGHVAEQIAGA